jgi:hypothetical protein
LNPPGTKPAKVNVRLDTISVASKTGRLLFSANSYLAGTVSIHDKETDQLLVLRRFQTKNEGSRSRASVNGNPLVGVIINLAVNAANSSDTRRIGLLTEDFARQTEKWLELR